MTLAIILVCLVLYLGLAVAVGRFCGINSAWDRVVETAIIEDTEAEPDRSESLTAEKLDEAERILEQTMSRSEEERTAAQTV